MALPRDRPLALVLGHEEHGITQEVRAVCRREIRIEGRGAIQSLNVAQAAAILLAAFTTPLTERQACGIQAQIGGAFVP